MEPAILGEPFDRFDVLALACNGKCQTRTDKTAIDDHAASPADSDAAAFLGAGKADVIPQDLQQQPVRFQLQIVLFTVDGQSDLLFHESGAYLLLSIDSTYEAEHT
jgi:hypothetical protein